MSIGVEREHRKVYYDSRFRIRFGERMSMQRIVAGTGIAAAAILLMATAFAVIQPSTSINHNGSIQTLNVSVFQDSACTQSLSTLSWGTLKPGTSANRTIYVKNTGNAALALNMTVTTWNPSTAASYITLTWDRQSFVLTQGNSIPALLVLSASANVTGFTDFTCTTIIAGNA
jgi:hypothetical protein